jgi:signal transduction histidine kinase
MSRSGTFGTSAPGGSLSAEERRTERSIALVRIAVVAVVAYVYLISIGIRPAVRPFAPSVLVLAAVYAIWSLLARPDEIMSTNRFNAATLLVDAALITLWLVATGGTNSEYWTLYLIALVAVAMRYSLMETFFSALGLAALYVIVLSINGGASPAALLSRLPVLLIAGFALGVLAQQRSSHQVQRELLAQIAEDRSQALAEEQALVARLREVDLAKSEFVAVAAHEFRTPLAAILGVFSTLRTHGDGLDPSVREELLVGAETQAQRLGRLVDDLLTIARIEDGALRLDVQPIEAEWLVSHAIQVSRTGDRVRIDLGGVQTIWCDPDHMVRVLTNLIDNARKYSPPDGAIFITLAQSPSTVSVSVRDEGPGIPKERRAEVFERFRRLGEKPKKPGAGLGLYITRSLVEAHGGTIRVDEAPGGGADFNFTIPQAERDQPVSTDRPAAATAV